MNRLFFPSQVVNDYIDIEKSSRHLWQELLESLKLFSQF